MPNILKQNFLLELEKKYGKLKKLPNSQSLYFLSNGEALIYIRYSKIHHKSKTFFGLRKEDLNLLSTRNSFIVFLWDDQESSVFLPYSDFEDIFSSITPANDGQYKVQILLNKSETELYIANAGKFNVEGYIGWKFLFTKLKNINDNSFPSLSHSQIQTFLGYIGSKKGFDIWIPQNDRNKIIKEYYDKLQFRKHLPDSLTNVKHIVQEIDVIWFEKGHPYPKNLFEVEHSTPIYSGLLRMNDYYISFPDSKLNFNIVSNEARKSIFIKQIARPTFKASGISELCSFLDYRDVYNWLLRIK